MARRSSRSRDNAIFTGAPVPSYGPRESVDVFYFTIDDIISDDTHIPIPPPETVHPHLDRKTQRFIFADFAIRKFAPIALDKLGFREEAKKLRGLNKIVNATTATTASIAADEVARVCARYGTEVANHAAKVVAETADAATIAVQEALGTPVLAAQAACFAAELDPDPTWKAVNEMLSALCGKYYRDNPRSRKNAGHGDGSRKLVDVFYYAIDELIHNSDHAPIPPLESVHPKHDAVTQACILADCAVRKIAPLALNAAGLRTAASKLHNLPEIVDRLTAQAAAAAAADARSAADYAADNATKATYPVYAAAHAAADNAAYAADNAALAAAFANRYKDLLAATAAEAAADAAKAVAEAAKLNPAETWKAVTEMLKSL